MFTYNSVDKFDIARALAVAISSAILSASLVAVVLGKTAILIHRNKVKGTIQTAADTRDINVESEFVAQDSEHLIGTVILHKIETTTNVGAIRTLGHKLQAELIATGGNSICA